MRYNTCMFEIQYDTMQYDAKATPWRKYKDSDSEGNNPHLLSPGLWVSSEGCGVLASGILGEVLEQVPAVHHAKSTEVLGVVVHVIPWVVLFIFAF